MRYVQCVVFSLGALVLHIYNNTIKIILHTLKRALFSPLVTRSEFGFLYFIIINCILPHCRSPPYQSFFKTKND